ncbi:MAG TPA: exodeoxyribonuclease VII small subunit [Nevskiaceae bacterium]|nr:exodeoxyribonuclease VII small subunit [Nevskiaceae bacterium]
MTSRKPPTASDPATADTDRVGQFEHDLAELEQIVQQMEAGELPLEQSLKLYERGVALGRLCRDSLAKAELRVRELTTDAPTPDIDSQATTAPATDAVPPFLDDDPPF